MSLRESDRPSNVNKCKGDLYLDSVGLFFNSFNHDKCSLGGSRFILPSFKWGRKSRNIEISKQKNRNIEM